MKLFWDKPTIQVHSMFLLFFAGLFIYVASIQSCLNSELPTLSNITVNLKEIPLILSSQLDSCTHNVASEIYAILLREKLGINAMRGNFVGTDPDFLMLLSGCAYDKVLQAADCSIMNTIPDIHVASEMWYSTYPDTDDVSLLWPSVDLYNKRLDFDLTASGYMGITYHFIQLNAVMNARSSDLILDHYFSWHQTPSISKFSTPEDILNEGFSVVSGVCDGSYSTAVMYSVTGLYSNGWKCAVGTDWFVSSECLSIVPSHVSLVGSVDDAVLAIAAISDGTQSPYNIADLQGCVPMAVHDAWPTLLYGAFDVTPPAPFVLGIFESLKIAEVDVGLAWDPDIVIITDWFWPDSTLVNLLQHKTVYPPTFTAPTEIIYKGIWTGLKKYSLAANDLLSKGGFSEDDVNEWLVGLADNQEVDDIACDWVTSHESKWTEWIKMVCLAGQRLSESECVACEVGEYSEAGASECIQCSPGSFSRGSAAECTSCSEGSFQSLSSASSCDLCPEGYYSSSVGAIECIQCPDTLWSSLGSRSATDCTCGVGSQWNEILGRCSSCQEGLDCSKASKNTKDVAAGFWAPVNGVLGDGFVDVYKCINVVACPGGSLGTCAENRNGIACGQCGDHFYESSTTGECVKCGDFDAGYLIIALLVLLSLTIIVYKFTHSPMKASQRATLSSTSMLAFELFIGFAQNFALLTVVEISWPSMLNELMDIFEVFLLDMSMLRPSCLFKTSSVLAEYLTTVLIPVLIVFWIAGLVWISRLLDKCFIVISNASSGNFSVRNEEDNTSNPNLKQISESSNNKDFKIKYSVDNISNMDMVHPIPFKSSLRHQHNDNLARCNPIKEDANEDSSGLQDDDMNQAGSFKAFSEHAASDIASIADHDATPSSSPHPAATTHAKLDNGVFLPSPNFFSYKDNIDNFILPASKEFENCSQQKVLQDDSVHMMFKSALRKDQTNTSERLHTQYSHYGETFSSDKDEWNCDLDTDDDIEESLSGQSFEDDRPSAMILSLTTKQTHFPLNKNINDLTDKICKNEILALNKDCEFDPTVTVKNCKDEARIQSNDGVNTNVKLESMIFSCSNSINNHKNVDEVHVHFNSSFPKINPQNSSLTHDNKVDSILVASILESPLHPNNSHLLKTNINFLNPDYKLNDKEINVKDGDNDPNLLTGENSSALPLSNYPSSANDENQSSINKGNWISSKMCFFWWKGPMDSDKAFNTCGMILTTVYTFTCASCLSIFSCYDHPGGKKSSVRSMPQILCGEGEWKTLLMPLAVLFTIFFIVGLYVFLLIVNIRAPILSKPYEDDDEEFEQQNGADLYASNDNNTTTDDKISGSIAHQNNSDDVHNLSDDRIHVRRNLSDHRLQISVDSHDDGVQFRSIKQVSSKTNSSYHNHLRGLQSTDKTSIIRINITQPDIIDNGDHSHPNKEHEQKTNSSTPQTLITPPIAEQPPLLHQSTFASSLRSTLSSKPSKWSRFKVQFMNRLDKFINNPLHPTRRRNKSDAIRFVQKYHFLFGRYRHDMWWWESIVMVRNLLLSMVTAIFHSTYSQLLTFSILLLVSISIHSIAWPLRDKPNNILELCLLSCMALYVSVAMYTVDPDEDATGYEAMGWVATIILCSLVIACGIIIFYSLWVSRTSQKLKNHEKSVEMARNLKAVSLLMADVPPLYTGEVISELNPFDHSIVHEYLSLAESVLLPTLGFDSHVVMEEIQMDGCEIQVNEAVSRRFLEINDKKKSNFLTKLKNKISPIKNSYFPPSPAVMTSNNSITGSQINLYPSSQHAISDSHINANLDNIHHNSNHHSVRTSRKSHPHYEVDSIDLPVRDRHPIRSNSPFNNHPPDLRVNDKIGDSSVSHSTNNPYRLHISPSLRQASISSSFRATPPPHYGGRSSAPAMNNLFIPSTNNSARNSVVSFSGSMLSHHTSYSNGLPLTPKRGGDIQSLGDGAMSATPSASGKRQYSIRSRLGVTAAKSEWIKMKKSSSPTASKHHKDQRQSLNSHRMMENSSDLK